MMILGRITGKITTNEFKFIVEKETKKFEYVQVYHKAYDYILCQVIELETDHDKTTAYCQVLGYKDKGRIKKPRIPFDQGSEVLKAEDQFIKDVVKLESEYKGFIGKLDGKDIDVSLNLNKVLTMHLAVLAKSGSGKSYAVGVLLEEMLDKKIPVIVIDPHGEYSSLKYKNDNPEDLEKLKMFNLYPHNYQIKEYGDPELIKGANPIKLHLGNNQEELLNLLPGKLSSSQTALLYSALKTADASDLNSLIFNLEQEENNNKYSVISMVEYLKDLKIFSNSYVNYSDLIKQGQCSIINLKGINPEVQEMIVYKLSKELFDLRKKEKIPPFFLVMEEAHNYCPERSFGETKASKTLRNIASEGRKFGLGLCIISQRPARVDKSILSQCSSQIILKVTNPNDLKAISNSLEGITSSTEKEIQNLVIGQALITGVTEMPLLVNIRPRKTLHGGTAKDIVQETPDFTDKLEDYDEEMMPLIKPTYTAKDVKLMSEKDVEVETNLIPCKLITCTDKTGEYNLLIELLEGGVVVNKDDFKTKFIPNMDKLTKTQINILKRAFKVKTFTEKELNGDFKKELTGLKTKQYLVEKEGVYKLSDKYIFSKLHHYKNLSSIEYDTVKYDNKLISEVEPDEVKKILSRFTEVNSEKDCFLINYKTKQ